LAYGNIYIFAYQTKIKAMHITEKWILKDWEGNKLYEFTNERAAMIAVAEQNHTNDLEGEPACYVDHEFEEYEEDGPDPDIAHEEDKIDEFLDKPF
jgi:hypothetical protein